METATDTHFGILNISTIRLHPTDEEIQQIIAGANNE